MKEEKPNDIFTDDGLIVTYQKNAGSTDNRVIIPKFFIERHGRQFYMDVYKDKLVIRPIGKENENGTKKDV